MGVPKAVKRASFRVVDECHLYQTHLSGTYCAVDVNPKGERTTTMSHTLTLYFLSALLRRSKQQERGWKVLSGAVHNKIFGL